ALAHRRRDRGRVPLEVADDLVARHEPVRVVAVVRVARQLHGPVRRDEAEALPAPAPGLADPAALEHDVADAGAPQLVARREPGLPAADDDDVELLDCGHPGAAPRRSGPGASPCL